ncbi:MAG: HYR domain-containing protein, partial [Bacteroidetes bacterium]
NTSLTFNSNTAESILKWTAPSGVQRGDVIVIKETSSNTFSLSCTDGTGGTCGTLVHVNGSSGFALSAIGEGLYAYGDTDDDPTNGITEIYSVLYTGDGENGISGGNIPALRDPFAVYANAVVVDGFPAIPPNRTEYKPSLRNVTVSQGNFEDLTKWDHGQTNADLSTTPFTNIIIKTGSANSPVTVTVSPGSVLENSGTSMVFTFTLNGPSQGDFDVSFQVSGTATYLTDYTVTTQGGNSSFNANSGVVTIFNVLGSGTITVTPVADSGLEPDETVILSIVSGTNYDAGSPGSATGTILNDDVGPSTCPLVAVTGLNHLSPDGFSFVALTDITAGTEIYFTDNPYSTATLAFDTGEAVMKWTAPAGVNQGDVFVVKETSPDVLALSCTDGSGGTCGAISLESGNFAVGPNGEAFYAYLDTDNNPGNGITEILAVLYTGDSETTSPGGNIPASESPAVIYPSSIVVDGFPATAPNRTEYNPSTRNVSVDQADVENPTNWVHAQANADLSTTPFVQIEILLSISCPADQLNIEGCSPEYLNSTTSLPYSTSVQTISVADFTGEGGSINSGGTVTSVTYVDAVSGTYPFTVTRTFTVIDDCPNTAICTQTFIIDDTTAPTADTPADINVTCPAEVPAPDISVVTGVADNCVPSSCEIWINEIHYDNSGADTGEFVEVAGRAGTDLTSYSIVYYNGNDGGTYDSPTALTGTIDNESNGFGAVSFAKSGIQNGDPDGLALVKNGTTVIEFISYEGTFTATNGPALGMTSVDIGVSEPSSQAVGESLSKTGTGNTSADFTFTDGAESPGDLNIGQTMTPAPPCGGSVTVTHDSDTNNGGAGSAASPLVITRTYKLQDPAGNMGSVQQTINVIDNTVPTITCPADITSGSDQGVCGATISFSATGSDNCGVSSITYSQDPGTIFNVGTTTVTATATDLAGNTATCTFDVTVNDTESPMIACPTSFNANTDPGQNGATVSFNSAVATDNCPGVAISMTPSSGSFFALNANGTSQSHTVTAVATDAAGNQDQCFFTITVVDPEAPAITCPANITVSNTPGSCGANVSFSISATDNSGVVPSVNSTFNSGDFFPIGTTTVNSTATDPSGNTSGCSFTVTVNEDQPAVAVCATNVTLDLTSDGTTILTPALVDGGSNSCGSFTLSVAPNQFNCDNVGDMVTVTLTATDDSNGNSSTCMTTVTIDDPNAYCCAPPDAICQNQTISLNANGMASITVADINNNSTAECGLASMVLSQTSFDCSNKGQNTVTLTVTDVNGDADACTATVTVEDNMAPTAVCQNATVVLDAQGNGSVQASNLDGGSTDNCSTTFSYVPTAYAFTCSSVGSNTVTLTVVDESLNTSNCTATVTVIDNIFPDITCPGDIVQNNDPGQCGATINLPTPQATDNCGIAVMEFRYIEVDPDNGNAEIGTWTGWSTNTNVFFAVGSWKVEWNVEDPSMNGKVCDFYVTINDNQDPVITCPGTVTSGTDPGQCGANVSFTVTATDNCDVTYVCTIGGDGDPEPSDCYSNIVQLSLTLDDFPGETTWMLLDGNGSMIENGGPYFIAGETITETFNLPDGDYIFMIKDVFGDGICCAFGQGSYTLSSNGEVIGTGGDFGEGDKINFCVEAPSGGSGIPLTEVQSGDFFPVGTTTVTCTATDASGNTDVCTFDIVVIDTEAPQIATPCPQNITLCGAQNVSWTPPTATDNCAVVASTSNYNPGDFFQVGNYTVTYTFYDAAGLSVSCSFTITINPLPEVQITQEDLPTWCQGIQVLNAEVLNIAELTLPLTYSWSNGLGSTSSVIAPDNGTYFVTVTDALGCFTVESTTVNEDISSLLSAYTIISGEEFEMYESEVISGGVGIEDADEAEIAQNSSIFTFLRADADNVQVDGSSFINNFIDADFNVNFPTFESNPHIDLNSVVVSAGSTMTISGSNYGYVVVGAGATLIINSSEIFMRVLYTYGDATIIFNQPTKVKIRRKMYIGESNVINPDGHTTVFFVGDNAAIAQGTNFTANIYAPEGLEVNDSGSTLTTYMTGMFISNDGIVSDYNVIWNWNLNCSYLPETQTPPVIPFSEQIDLEIPEATLSDKVGLNVFPNPTSGLLNIDVSDFMESSLEVEMFNALGEVVWSQQIDRLEMPLITRDMAELADGVYFLKVTSKGESVSKQIILSR